MKKKEKKIKKVKKSEMKKIKGGAKGGLLGDGGLGGEMLYVMNKRKNNQ